MIGKEKDLKKALFKNSNSLRLLDKFSTSKWIPLPVYSITEALKPEPKINKNLHNKEIKIEFSFKVPAEMKSCISYVKVEMKNTKLPGPQSLVESMKFSFEQIQRNEYKLVTLMIMEKDFLENLKHYRLTVEFKKRNFFRIKKVLENITFNC
jgi:hypothetical protein